MTPIRSLPTGPPRVAPDSERRSALRAALEGGFQAYAVADPVTDPAGGLVDLVVVYGNEPACHSLRIPIENLRGRSISDLWPAGVRDSLLEAASGVLASGAPAEVLGPATPSGAPGHAVRLFRLGNRLGLLWPGGGQGAAADQASEMSGYRQAWDEMSIGMLLADPIGRITRCNPAAAELLGVDCQELVGQVGWAAVREDGSQFDSSDQPVAVCRRTGAVVRDVVMGITRPNHPARTGTSCGTNGLRWALVNATPVRGASGAVQSVIVSLRDITDFRASQAALRAADARFAGVVDALGDPVYVLEPLLDEQDALVDFVVSQFNPAGGRPGRWLPGAGGPQAGARLSAFYPGSAGDGFAAACRACLETGEPRRLVVTWPWPGATVRDFDVTIVRFPGAEGLALAVVGRDVTSVLADRARVAASELRFRGSLDALTDPVFLFTPVHDQTGEIVDLRYTHVNTAGERLYARPAHEIVGHRLLELFPSSVENGALDCYLEPLRTGRAAHLRIPLFSEGGVTGAFDVSASLCGEEVVVAGHDITAQLAAEAELARSRQQFQTLAENATDVVMLIGTDLRIEWISGTGALGWTAAELVGQEVTGFLMPEDLTADKVAALQELLAGRVVTQPAGGYVFGMRCKGGGYRWMASTPKPVTNDDGTPMGMVAGLRDVDALVRSQQDAQAARDRLDATLESLIDPHVMLKPVRDDQGQIVDFIYTQANTAACTYNHRGRDQMLGRSLLEALPAHLQTGLLATYAETFETGSPLVLDDVEYHQELIDQTRYYNIRAVRVGDELSYTWTDVTAKHEAAAALAESEDRYRLLAEHASDLVARIDTTGTVDWISPSVRTVLGYPPDQVLNQPLAHLLHADDKDTLAEQIERLGCGEQVSMRARMRRADRQFLWMEITLRPTPGSRTDPDMHHVLSLRDIDQQVQMESELRRRAQYDDLTGLLKREEALTRLTAIADDQRRRGAAIAALFIDVDGFKAVNDTHGHGVGDQVLRELAARIRATLRTTDIVARMGGDEFLCILEGVHDITEATVLADHIRQAVEHPIQATNGPPTHVSVSIGVTLLHPGDSVDDLIYRADTAMYHAKSDGRNRTEILDIPPILDTQPPRERR